jgi:RNA ligase (TIGR02306 family)
MSDLRIESVRIDEVIPHPNADRLDLIRIGAYTVCDQRGKHTAGDIVVFFPPDMLIPPRLAQQIGVDNYLKDAIYPGEAYKAKCRVGAIRLRGCPSFGFILKNRWATEAGLDMTERFHGVKFEPPEAAFYRKEVNAKGDPRFHTYTDIQNYRNSKYTNAIPDGTEVRITEKIHGTNSRIGIIDGEFMCGSHQTVKKALDQNDKPSTYWGPFNTIPGLKEMLEALAATKGGNHNVVAFGEIYGSKIQFMDYGVVGNNGYRLFDISYDGVYMSYDEVEHWAALYNVPLVPLLYRGPFSADIVDKFVDGPTTVIETDKVHSTFKDREGIVITPVIEQYSPALGGRMILKAVSVDYLEKRKTDSH